MPRKPKRRRLGGFKFRFRKTLRVGNPKKAAVYAILTQHGITSWGVQAGRFRRNFTTGHETVDTPGLGWIERETEGSRRTSGPLLTWRQALAVAGIVGLPVAAIVTWLVVAVAGAIR